MDEISKDIEGYRGLYQITESGRVITLRNQRPLARCGDEYGFHIVSLSDQSGNKQNHNVFDLWKKAFPEYDHSRFKGSLKIKYGKECTLLKRSDVHFQ